jgi:hypothetical protein
MVSEYRDAVFAREALREQGEQMQMEDEEFREKFPPVLFKDWLKGRKRDG